MISCTLVMQGTTQLSSRTGVEVWIVGAVAMLSALCLVLGLFTPVVSLLVAVGVVGARLCGLLASATNFFFENLIVTHIAVTSFALLLLGPGAFSMDARFFGRREIIIPPTHPSPDA